MKSLEHYTIRQTVIKKRWVLLIALMLNLFLTNKSALAQTSTLTPTAFTCKVQPYYKHRKDGKPGREITLSFKGSKLTGMAKVKVECMGATEETTVSNSDGIDQLSVLLPEGAGVSTECQAKISVTAQRVDLHQSIMVPVKRYWTVYVYPHSHVDIGYTNTQEFVRKLHVRNIDVAIDIAQKTQNYPEGSRFVWNPEANWVTENYLQTATPQQKKRFIEAVRKGWISLDGNYANINTSTCSDEELLRLFHSKHHIEKVTGSTIKTMVQMDVAGAAWGITQAAYQNGIRGFFHFPNIGTVRWPWENKPFYWVAPDGKSKIFFLQALPYGFGWEIKGIKMGLRKMQGGDTTIDRITTADPTANFIDPLIFEETAKQEAYHSPYAIFVLPWALADNALIDADLPEAARLWNEKYAYPKVIISGSQRILEDYERRYGNIIPQVKGDYTEFWTDGLGTDAKRISLYRKAKENLVQAETAWSMLNPGKPSPRAAIDTAWENSLLGAEHTWGYQDPKAPLAKQIEDTKAGFFENAFSGSTQLLTQTFKSISKPASGKIAVFNTLSWDRDGLITLAKEQAKNASKVIDDKGQEAPSQRLSTGELAFFAKAVPTLGSRVFTISSGTPSASKGCSISGNVLSNNIISITIDKKTGDISSLINLKNGYEYVDKQSEYGLNSYRYLLGTDTTNKGSAPKNIVLKVKENGPLMVSILIESSAEGVNWLTREIKLVLNQPWVDITNSFDKISTRTKEGIHFGYAFNVPNGTTRLDIPWGVMIPEADQLPASNKSWLTFQRWVDVSNNNNGITWTCIESPLIEVGGITANVLGGAHGRKNWYKTITKTQPLFSWPVNNHWGTNFPLEQGGIMTFHYSILPHKGYDPAMANRFGMEQNRPLLAVPVDKKPDTRTWVKISNPMVSISTLKQSDDGKGMIVRLRSVSDKPEKVMLSWPNGKPRKLYSCLADEKPVEAIKTDQTILPYGTISYYFEK